MIEPNLGATLVKMKATNGQEAREGDRSYNVPKTALLDRLEYVLRIKKLRIAPGPLTDQFVREMSMLRRELQPSGYVTYTTSIHDDLVMAVAMAVWCAWEQHKAYLQVPGPVPIVSSAGVLESPGTGLWEVI